MRECPRACLGARRHDGAVTVLRLQGPTSQSTRTWDAANRARRARFPPAAAGRPQRPARALAVGADLRRGVRGVLVGRTIRVQPSRPPLQPSTRRCRHGRGHGHKSASRSPSRSQVSVTVTVTVTSQRPLRMSDNAIRRLSRSQMRRAAAVAPVDTTAPSRYRRRRRSARAPARCGARPPRPPARSCPCGVSHGRARSELDTGPDPHQIRVTHLLLRTSFSSPGPLPSVCTSHGLAPVGGQDCVGGIGALAHTILTLCDEDCFCGV